VTTVANVDKYKQALLAERDRVQRAIDYMHVENPGSIGEETGEVDSGWDNHLADTATATVDREIDYTLEENSGNVLREIEAALKRIDEGTYGICAACGEPIEPERLEYLPWATLCAKDARGSRG